MLILVIGFFLVRLFFPQVTFINGYTFQETENPLIIPLARDKYTKFLDKLETAPGYVYISLNTIETKKLYGIAFLFFDPKIKNNLSLEAFQKYSVPDRTTLNINFYQETINGSQGIVDNHEPQTINNLKIYFDSYANRILKGRVEFDIPALRFSLPRANASRTACIDPGMTPGGFDACFDTVFAPTNKKVSMPFEINAY